MEKRILAKYEGQKSKQNKKVKELIEENYHELNKSVSPSVGMESREKRPAS